MHPVLAVHPLGFVWHTLDPFLFCVHHDDAYPAGNAHLGPAASLAGRNIGSDFEGKDGWRMYHGDTVPGFPHHPHRGFETVTIVRQGQIDHSDSLGATARFGNGDVQWLTAGRGIVHSEMFPLLNPAGPNPAELFQIWLNLPKRNKLCDPYFTMFWADRIPVLHAVDEQGRRTAITVIAGAVPGLGTTENAPPPDSWASQPGSDLAIWTLKMEAGARWTLPPAQPGTRRMLYFFAGSSMQMAGRAVHPRHGVELRGELAAELVNGDAPAELLLLQARPIGEPVAQQGPFVMNTPGEVLQAYADYRRTGFGGWPFPQGDPVHPSTQRRFARHPDARLETPPEIL